MRIVSVSALGAPVKGYLHEDHDRLIAHKQRPALIVCPGGAYRFTCPGLFAMQPEIVSASTSSYIAPYRCPTDTIPKEIAVGTPMMKAIRPNAISLSTSLKVLF